MVIEGILKGPTRPAQQFSLMNYMDVMPNLSGGAPRAHEK
jgi:hypothetical protein